MDNIPFGLEVTVIGLAIVFGLLAVMWLLLTLALRLEARRPMRAPTVGPASDASPIAIRPLDGAGDPDPALIAAIAVAVARHADQRRRAAAPAMRNYWPGSLLFASRWVAAGRTRQTAAWRGRGR